MMRKILVILTLVSLLVATAALAGEYTARKGDFAMGFNNTDAPVGIRYFMSDKVAVDFGVGFQGTDLGDETASSFWFDLGMPYILRDYGNAFFFLRPALTLGILDNRDAGLIDYPVMADGVAVDDTWTQFTGALYLGGEVEFNDHLGVTFQHGFGIVSMSPPGNGDSMTDFGTVGENVTEAGVWFTF